MRIVTQDTVGGPEVLHVRDVPVPQPREGEVLVRIAAAGINPVDTFARAGSFAAIGAAPFTIGWDLAGIVESTGPGVSTPKVGQRVFGLSRFPKQAAAYAEYATVPAGELAIVPNGMSDAEAGAMPLAALTAWQALVDEAGMKAGDRVLIHAGAGGVGHLAIQIAKALGARVATTVSAAKADFARSIGADETIDYKETDFSAMTDAFDIVLDSIGGDHVLKSLKTLSKGGIVVCIKALSEDATKYAEDHGLRLKRMLVHPDGGQMSKLADLVRDGKLKVTVAATYPLEQAGEAHRFLATGPVGKVVLVTR